MYPLISFISVCKTGAGVMFTAVLKHDNVKIYIHIQSLYICIGFVYEMWGRDAHNRWNICSQHKSSPLKIEIFLVKILCKLRLRLWVTISAGCALLVPNVIAGFCISFFFFQRCERVTFELWFDIMCSWNFASGCSVMRKVLVQCQTYTSLKWLL